MYTFHYDGSFSTNPCILHIYETNSITGLKRKTPPSREPEREGASQRKSEENGSAINDGGSLIIPQAPFSAQELERYLMLAIHSKELSEQLEVRRETCTYSFRHLRGRDVIASQGR